MGTQIFQQQLLGDTGTWTTGISKVSATGSTFGIQNQTVYDNNNSPIRQDGVPSTFLTNYDFTFNQPLLQGAGLTYNRIAGPDAFNNINGRPNFRGVLIARVLADQSLADFEIGVRNMVSDTEQAYWELYFAYRNLEARKPAVTAPSRPGGRSTPCMSSSRAAVRPTRRPRPVSNTSSSAATSRMR